MADQLTQFTAMMELNNKEIGWCLNADPPWEPESVTEQFSLIRARLAEAIRGTRGSLSAARREVFEGRVDGLGSGSFTTEDTEVTEEFRSQTGTGESLCR